MLDYKRNTIPCTWDHLQHVFFVLLPNLQTPDVTLSSHKALALSCDVTVRSSAADSLTNLLWRHHPACMSGSDGQGGPVNARAPPQLEIHWAQGNKAPITVRVLLIAKQKHVGM